MGSMRSMLTRIGTVAALPAVLLLAGCDEGGQSPLGPGGGDGTASVSLSVAGPPGSGIGASASPAFALTRTDGAGNELVLDRVAVVLREIELERQNDDCADDLPGEDDDDCEEFEAGIRLLEVPLDGSPDRVVTLQVPADVYDELEFDIHKPDDDTEEGRQFLQQHPEFEDVSIRVEGSFNGQPFVFLQDLNEEQERDLVPPLVVEEGAGPVNLTLRLDVRTWFTTDGSPDGPLVDPASANDGGPNEDLVEENIEASIEVFEDDDEDGEEDDEDDDDEDGDDDEDAEEEDEQEEEDESESDDD